MILGKFSALQQGRQGCHSKPGPCCPGAPGRGSAPNPRFWVATAAAMTGAGRNCGSSCGPGIALKTWGPNCEFVAKMTLMHHDAPVWHRKTFCVALHSLHHRRFCCIIPGRCHWYHMKWWIWFPAWWIPWACWRQRTRGTLYHATSIIERGAGLGPRPSYFIWLDNLLFIHLSGCFSRTI